jgi:hypothetical protein
MMLDYTLHTCPRCKLFKHSKRSLDMDVNADGEITGAVTLEAPSFIDALSTYYCKYRWWNCPLEEFNNLPICKHYKPKY